MVAVAAVLVEVAVAKRAEPRAEVAVAWAAVAAAMATTAVSR